MKFIDDQKLIEFNETDHIYKYNGQELKSITEWIGSFDNGFDKDGSILSKCAIKEGISQKALKRIWVSKGVKASRLGTFFHKSIEYYFKTNRVKKNKFTDIIHKFKENYKFQGKIVSECRIFSPSLGLCGTSDIVNLVDDKTIQIFDFKVTEKPINNYSFGRKYNAPIQHLNASKLNKYTLQLSAYAYILNFEYGLNIGNENALFRIDPKTREIEKIPVTLRMNEVMDMIGCFLYQKSLA